MPKLSKKSPTETPKEFTPKVPTPGMSGSGMSGMSDIQDQCGIPSRGRPPITDTAKLKTSTMTICLTPETHNNLRQLAVNQNQKPAAMGRILIESGIKELQNG